MERLTRLSLAYPRATLAVLLLITVGLGAGLPRVESEFGYRILIGDDHPAIRLADDFIEDFGGGLPQWIVWECKPGNPCSHALDAASLEMAAALDRTLSSSTAVQSVRTISDSAVLVPAAEGFHVRRFVEDGRVVEDAETLRSRALADPLWRGNLISEDGTVAAAIVQVADTDAGTAVAVMDAIDLALEPYTAKGFEFHLVGDPTSIVYSGRSLAESSGRLIPLTVIVIGAVVFLLSRSAGLTAAALATMGVALLWTIGLMGWLAWPQDGVAEVLAPLILVVGVCDAMHFLSRYSANMSESPRKREALIAAAAETGGPCLITTATTGAAFASFSLSALDTFVRFGLISTVGVTACLALSFSLLPILMERLPAPPRPRTKGLSSWSRLLEVTASIARRRLEVLATAALLLLVCTAGWAAKLQTGSDWHESFGEGTDVSRWARFVDAKLRPTSTIEFAIEFADSNTIYEPTTLAAIAGFEGAINGLEQISGTTSVVTLIERLNRALHADDPAEERIGDSAIANGELIELVGFDDRDLLATWLNFDRTRARVSASSKTWDYATQVSMLEEIQRLVQVHLPDFKVSVTGSTPINVGWIRDVQATQLRSFPTALLLVFALLTLFFRSPLLGAVALFPTLVATVVTLGVMGWLDMSLDVARAMIAAVIIGIGVDDAVHLLSRYKVAKTDGASSHDAIDAAVFHCGPAVVTTSVALALGFMTLMASAWQTISSFGFFVALSIVAALFATLLILPALVFTFAKDR